MTAEKLLYALYRRKQIGDRDGFQNLLKKHTNLISKAKKILSLFRRFSAGDVDAGKQLLRHKKWAIFVALGILLDEEDTE